jgi:hypothetical protein
LIFFTFVVHFKLDPDPKPELQTEPECFPVPVPLRQKLRSLRFRLRFHNTGESSVKVSQVLYLSADFLVT